MSRDNASAAIGRRHAAARLSWLGILIVGCLAGIGIRYGLRRDERNQADYDLKLRRFDGPTVALILQATHEIVDAIER